MRWPRFRARPGYRYLTTPHPVAGLTREQVRERAEAVAAEVAGMLADGTGREAREWRRTPRARSRRGPRGDRVLLRAGLDRRAAGGAGLAVAPRPVPRPDQPRPRRGAVADGSPRTRVHGPDRGDQRGDGRLPARVLPGRARRVGRGHARPGGQGRRVAVDERTGAADRDQRPDPGRARDQLHRRDVRRGLPPQRDDPARARADAAQRVRRRPARVRPDDAGDPRAGGRSASGRTRRRARGSRWRPRWASSRARTRCRAR